MTHMYRIANMDRAHPSATTAGQDQVLVMMMMSAGGPHLHWVLLSQGQVDLGRLPATAFSLVTLLMGMYALSLLGPGQTGSQGSWHSRRMSCTELTDRE
jgi:hypothetical protein